MAEQLIEDVAAEIENIALKQAEAAMLEDVEEDSGLPEGIQNVLKWADTKENIVPYLDDDTIEKIREQVEGQYEDDYASMEEWRRDNKTALELARMVKSAGKKMTPFEGASKVMSPHLMKAAVDFSSRMLLEVMGRKEPARYELWP